MESFGTTDFDNNSQLITLSAIIISSLHYIYIYIYINFLPPLYSFNLTKQSEGSFEMLVSTDIIT
jgi:hypothetical protein